MEEKHNPNTSPEHLRRQDTSSSWSELPQDLLILVFERLRLTTDFKRAKSVCSSWYSASRHYVPEKQTTPWLILFPEDENINNQNHNSCLLFNLEEKHKLYKTQDLGLDFTKSVCMTTYGNWLLMRDPQNNLYIVNLFTQERINLPPVKSQLGQTTIRSPVFWIDEETKDYVVVWARENTYVVYAKKGDISWNRIPTISSCNDMVYKDHKLYVLSCSGNFTIFDFFGKIPRETFGCDNIKWIYDESWSVTRRKLVITLKGDVLVVERRICNKSYISFHVYKVYSSRFFKRVREVDSLGNESMLFDLGITVLAKNIKGLKKSCIYFDASNERHTSVVQLFNLTTRRMEPLRKFDCSSIQLCSARWFLPSF